VLCEKYFFDDFLLKSKVIEDINLTMMGKERWAFHDTGYLGLHRITDHSFVFSPLDRNSGKNAIDDVATPFRKLCVIKNLPHGEQDWKILRFTPYSSECACVAIIQLKEKTLVFEMIYVKNEIYTLDCSDWSTETINSAITSVDAYPVIFDEHKTYIMGDFETMTIMTPFKFVHVDDQNSSLVEFQDVEGDGHTVAVPMVEDVNGNNWELRYDNDEFLFKWHKIGKV
tara:strand:+ start:8608 stop:9288 length:681 start_codon:yes stop_codon:yes gene_type:complete